MKGWACAEKAVDVAGLYGVGNALGREGSSSKFVGVVSRFAHPASVQLLVLAARSFRPCTNLLFELSVCVLRTCEP